MPKRALSSFFLTSALCAFAVADVASEARVLDLVANNKNAIGYVDAASVTSDVNVVLTK